jgi:hypothetical protein
VRVIKGTVWYTFVRASIKQTMQTRFMTVQATVLEYAPRLSVSMINREIVKKPKMIMKLKRTYLIK